MVGSVWGTIMDLGSIRAPIGFWQYFDVLLGNAFRSLTTIHSVPFWD